MKGSLTFPSKEIKITIYPNFEPKKKKKNGVGLFNIHSKEQG